MNILKSAFDGFVKGFASATADSLREFASQVDSPQGDGSIERLCQELGWSVDERYDQGVVLYFNDPIIRIRKLLITVGDRGKVVALSALSAARVPVSNMSPDLLAYLLDRNRQMPLPAWSIGVEDGNVTFAASYCALFQGLDAALFKYVCEAIAKEANAFDTRMQAAGLL